MDKTKNSKNWFQKAVNAKVPYSLGGWSKSQSTETRRKEALASRPKNWTLDHKDLSAGRALLALANVTKDKATKKVAKMDSEYFFKLAKKKK